MKYNKDKPYSAGDLAEVDGIMYEATGPSWGVKPPNGPWKKQGTILGKVVKPKGDVSTDASAWDNTKTYNTGELVKQDGIIYIASSGSWGVKPPNGPWRELTKLPKQGKVVQETIKNDINANIIVVEQHGYDGKAGNDGARGPSGPAGIPGNDGRGLEFEWDGTVLKVRKEGELFWQGVDLRGPKGEDGLSIPAEEAPKVGLVETVVSSYGTRFNLDSYNTGISLIKATKAKAATLKTLTEGTNVTITDDGSTLTINAGASSETTQGTVYISSPYDTTIPLVSYAEYAFTINKIHNLKTASGTITASIEINGTPVTGLNGLSVTSTPQSPDATAANAVVVGDRVTLVLSSNSSSADLEFTMKVTK